MYTVIKDHVARCIIYINAPWDIYYTGHSALSPSHEKEENFLGGIILIGYFFSCNYPYTQV